MGRVGEQLVQKLMWQKFSEKIDLLQRLFLVMMQLNRAVKGCAEIVYLCSFQKVRENIALEN